VLHADPKTWCQRVAWNRSDGHNTKQSSNELGAAFLKFVPPYRHSADNLGTTIGNDCFELLERLPGLEGIGAKDRCLLASEKRNL
jgi:hypothetical protein